MRDFNRKQNGQFKKEVDYYKLWTLGIILLIIGLFVSFDVKIVDNRSVVQEVHAETIQASVKPPVKTISYNDLTQEDKIITIRTELQSLGIKDKNLEIFTHIIRLESNYRISIEPQTFVIHCETPKHFFYSREVLNKKQAYCNDTDTQVYKEKSYGLFQILPSTAKRNCIGYDFKESYKTQTRCAVDIFKKSGFYPWSTYESALKSVSLYYK